MNKLVIVLLALLVACAAPVVEPDANGSNETVEDVVKFEPYEGNTSALPVNDAPEENETNISAPVEEPVPSLPPSDESMELPSNDSAELPPADVFEDLSIGQQYKMMPELEALVEESECYEYTFEGIEQYSHLPIEVKKSVHLDYLGGKSWKGWILSLLFVRDAQMESGTSTVLIEDETVHCLDEENFSIDWAPVESKAEYYR